MIGERSIASVIADAQRLAGALAGQTTVAPGETKTTVLVTTAVVRTVGRSSSATASRWARSILPADTVGAGEPGPASSHRVLTGRMLLSRDGESTARARVPGYGAGVRPEQQGSGRRRPAWSSDRRRPLRHRRLGVVAARHVARHTRRHPLVVGILPVAVRARCDLDAAAVRDPRGPHHPRRSHRHVLRRRGRPLPLPGRASAVVHGVRRRSHRRDRDRVRRHRCKRGRGSGLEPSTLGPARLRRVRRPGRHRRRALRDPLLAAKIARGTGRRSVRHGGHDGVLPPRGRRRGGTGSRHRRRRAPPRLAHRRPARVVVPPSSSRRVHRDGVLAATFRRHEPRGAGVERPHRGAPVGCVGRREWRGRGGERPGTCSSETLGRARERPRAPRATCPSGRPRGNCARRPRAPARGAGPGKKAGTVVVGDARPSRRPRHRPSGEGSRRDGDHRDRVGRRAPAARRSSVPRPVARALRGPASGSSRSSAPPSCSGTGSRGCCSVAIRCIRR